MALKIVHCLRAPVGGLFRHVADLAAEQALRGHAVGIIADASTGGETARQRLDALEAVCSLGVQRIAMPRLPGAGDVAAIRSVTEIARRIGPDVMHGHGAKGGLYARIAGTRLRRGGRPIRVYTPHGGSLHYAWASPAGMLYLGVERYLRKFSDLIVFESEFGQSAFIRKVGSVGRLGRVAHNGVAETEFDPVPPEPDAADFVFVGELRALKGVDVLIRALATGPLIDRTAVIVGEGPDAAGFRTLAGELGVASRVSFPGAMPARRAFALGRCLVVPSRAESLPYVVLEAAAAGLPLVATGVGGIAEIFGDQAGRLVPPADPDALARAMREVADDPEAARSDAERLSADVARRFSVAAMADGVLAGYADALGAPRS